MKKLAILLTFAAFMVFNNSCIIELTPTTGEVIFWSDFADGAPIDVYFEGSYEGTINNVYDSAPDCGTSGNVTLTLEAGTYYDWYAEEDPALDGFRTWNSNGDAALTITADGCFTMRLYTNSKSEALIKGELSNGDGIVVGQKK